MEQNRANQIAYALMVIMASKRKPRIDFLTSIMDKIGKDPDDSKRILDNFLEEYPMEELKEFSLKLLQDGHNFNIENFKYHFSGIMQRNENEKFFENVNGKIRIGTKVSFETMAGCPWSGDKEGTLVFEENEFQIKLTKGFGTIYIGNGYVEADSIKEIK